MQKVIAPIASNVPVSVHPSVTSDDMALIMGTCLPLAAVLIDHQSDGIVGFNQRLLGLIESDSELIGTGNLPFEQLILPEDRDAYRAWKSSALAGEEARLEVRLQDSSSAIPVQVFLSSLFWKKRRYVLGFLRELGPVEDLEERARKLLEEQKARTYEAIRSSLRMYQLNEKIRRTPSLAQKLLHASSESELFAEAAGVLTADDGLGYQAATFFLLEAGTARMVFSTRDCEPKVYSLNEDNRLSRLLRGANDPRDTADSAIWVPIRTTREDVGFLEVVPHPREKVLFDQSSVMREWQRGVLNDIGGIIALIVENLRLNREIKRQSQVDSLTGAYTRHYFVERLATEIQRAERYSRPISALFVDVDKFKQINDRYGHLQGDEILRGLGRILIDNLRDVDVVCRYGGDEFVVLLPETDNVMGLRTAEKLLETIRAHAFRVIGKPGEAVEVTVSIGVSALSPDEKETNLLRAADEALYRAKSLGRNRVESLTGDGSLASGSTTATA